MKRCIQIKNNLKPVHMVVGFELTGIRSQGYSSSVRITVQSQKQLFKMLE